MSKQNKSKSVGKKSNYAQNMQCRDSHVFQCQSCLSFIAMPITPQPKEYDKGCVQCEYYCTKVCTCKKCKVPPISSKCECYKYMYGGGVVVVEGKNVCLQCRKPVSRIWCYKCGFCDETLEEHGHEPSECAPEEGKLWKYTKKGLKKVRQKCLCDERYGTADYCPKHNPKPWSPLLKSPTAPEYETRFLCQDCKEETKGNIDGKCENCGSGAVDVYIEKSEDWHKEILGFFWYEGKFNQWRYNRMRNIIKSLLSKQREEIVNEILEMLKPYRELHKHRAKTHTSERSYKAGKYIGWRDAIWFIDKLLKT